MDPIRNKPLRSVLYSPGDKPRALEKARGLGADAVIFDLEDAVAPGQKAAARASLKAALDTSYGGRLRLVRINALETEWGLADLRAVADMGCDAVLLPKLSRPEQIDALIAVLDRLRPGLPVWGMMETAEGVLNAASIAAHPRLQGLVMGTNDLARELCVTVGPQRPELATALSMTVLAARAHGVAAIDGVYNAFQDDAGCAREAAQGLAFGFDGKTVIHPSQIPIANEAFAPSAEALALAHRQIEAFAEATARGEGVAVLDGRIVENLHIVTAEALIARDAAIRALHGEES